MRNAVADAIALGILDCSTGALVLRPPATASAADLVELGKKLVARQPAVLLAIECIREANSDKAVAGAKLGAALDAAWKPTSASRNLGGLLRYASWAGIRNEDV